MTDHGMTTGDPFDRMRDQLRRLNEVQTTLEVSLEHSRGLHNYESRRAADKASSDMETAVFWAEKVIKAIEKARNNLEKAQKIEHDRG
jgi:hypothetical protein